MERSYCSGRRHRVVVVRLPTVLSQLSRPARRTLDHQRSPWTSLWRQPVSMAMRMPWPVFFLAMTLIYLAEVLVFALGFQLDPGHVEADGVMGVPDGGIFALQNLFSASFQSARVSSPYTLGLAAGQRMVAILTTAMVTGLFFLRFTQVDSPLRFSRHLCLSGWPDGHLSCRFVTADPSYWLKVTYAMVLFVDEEIEPGVCQRRIHPLPLLNAATPQLHLTAVLSHRLTPESPLLQLGLDAIARASGAVMVLVEGSDEVTGSSLLQVHHYRLEDILRGRTFADLVSADSQGRRRVDFGALDRTVPIG